jgi:2'-5' RNA ligase
MRVFVGVELPDSVKQVAAARMEALRSRLERSAPRGVFRWVQPSNLHITVWFIGEVTEARLLEISGVLAHPYRRSAFAVQFGGVAVFPSPAKPRVISTGVVTGAVGLSALYQEIRERLEPLGFEPERREYSAHLTLARIKDLPRADSSAVRRVLSGPFTPFDAFRVTALTLFRSRLSSKGAEYESLLRVPLR